MTDHVQGRTAADDLVAALAAEGVSHLFINPGTDTAPVQEALAKARAEGTPHPRAVLCTHEFVALSSAMGHYFATGEPQAVMVHVDAGTLNLGGAVHNAQRNRVPVVVFAGRSPYSLDPEVPGHRDAPIQWQQEQLDQQAVLRAWGKWTIEVPRGRELDPLVRRAYQVVRSAPSGPGYVVLPREALMDPGADHLARALHPPRPAAPDPAGLAEAARLLAGARRPVIITDRTGADPETVPSLVRLAETLGAPVIDHRHRMNFPASHPLYAGADTSELATADAVLLLDVEVPWVPSLEGPPEDATVVQIDVDCAKHTMPSWRYPVDLALNADTAIALPMLAEAVSALGTELAGEAGDAEERWEQRRTEATARLAEMHDGWKRMAASPDADAAPDAMLAALNAALPPEAIVLEEAVTNKPAVARQIDRAPGHHYDTGSPALGWSVAGAMGVRLARPDAPIVAICGDGTFGFSVPTAAMWSAHRAGAPFAVVVLNNHAYKASRRPVEHLFPNGVATNKTDFPETELSPGPDYAKLAEAYGGIGVVVEHPAEMAAAVDRALKAVADGQCAIIDARIPSPGED